MFSFFLWLSFPFSDSSMDESTNSRLNESKKRTRGPTTCKKLREKTANKTIEKTIELDEYGKPKPGKWKKQFTSYAGAIVRQKVDINIESWKVVNDGLKDTIWEDIKVYKYSTFLLHLYKYSI